MDERSIELFSETDLQYLGLASGHRTEPDAADWFRQDSARISRALDQQATFDNLFDPEGPDPLLNASPLLVFATAVHRGAIEVGQEAHLPERFGPSLIIPVFDGAQLAQFTSEPAARSFLVELLGSYTRVLSGPRWERSRGRWRRRRFSEMDPAQLAQVATSLPAEERAGVYRRLGDLALFLNGVFPDNTSRRTLAPIELERILRSLPASERTQAGRLLEADRVDATGPVLAALGPSWYRLAAELIPVPSARHQLERAGEHFEKARRFLNFVTDRYLWNGRDRLFPAS